MGPSMEQDAGDGTIACSATTSALGDRYDVAVVGAGLAGTVAALRAQEQGRGVALFEKATTIPQGGNSMMSGGGFHVGFEALTHSPATIASRVRSMTEDHADETLLQAFAANCGPALSWLLAKGFALEEFPGNPTQFLTPYRNNDQATIGREAGSQRLLSRCSTSSSSAVGDWCAALASSLSSAPITAVSAA